MKILAFILDLATAKAIRKSLELPAQESEAVGVDARQVVRIRAETEGAVEVLRHRADVPNATQRFFVLRLAQMGVTLSMQVSIHGQWITTASL